jgi:hypothetical protein
MIASMPKKPRIRDNEPAKVPFAHKPPKANRLGVPLNCWINPQLMEVFEEYCVTNRRTKTAEVELAIENTLRNAGLWPPKTPAE